MRTTPHPHAALLRELVRAGVLTGPEMAARLGLDREALARVVERLSALGYIAPAGCPPERAGTSAGACASCPLSGAPAGCPVAPSGFGASGPTAWVLTARGRAFATRAAAGSPRFSVSPGRASPFPPRGCGRSG